MSTLSSDAKVAVGDHPTVEAAPEVGEVNRRLAANSHVAILTLSFWPKQAGMELLIHNLAVQLTYAGDHVTLYAPQPTRAFEEIPHDYLLKRFENEEHFLEMFRVQHSVLPFDVLLVQGALEAASMALQLKEQLGVPVVLRTHGEDIQVDHDSGYGHRRDPIKRAIIERNIRRVDRNVVIGEHIAPLITQVAPHAIVETIHNGVDTGRFRPRQTGYLRDRLKLSDEALILVTVGRNVRKKALHLAVDAMKRVVERVPQAVLVHAGKDGNGENLLERARALGVQESFFAVGEVSYFDTPLLYSSADLFVFPSKVEAFGNVTLEALSSGLPCVEFDYSVNHQKIASGRNGYIIPFGQVEQFADRIVELLSDADKRRAFSEEARNAAEERFAWPRVAEKYRSVFREFRSARSRCSTPAAGFGAASVPGEEAT
jgi:glycosyltransferase involved in cell wall biosynthesis